MKHITWKQLLLYMVANIALWTILLILIEWWLWPSEEQRSIASILFQSFFMGIVFTILANYLYKPSQKKSQ